MEEAQAKTNDIRDTIKAEILVRKVEGLTAGTYIIHWASVLSNHFDITGFKKVYGDLYKAFYRLPSKLFNFTPLTKYRYFVILILRYAIVYPTLVCAMDVFPIQRWKTVQQAGFGHFGATNSAKKIVTDRLFFKSNYFLYTYETYLGRRCEGAMGAVIPTIVIAPGSRSFALFGARTEHGVVLVVRQ